MGDATQISPGVDERFVRRALERATPWFLEARLERVEGGWQAALRLDWRMASARAEQQSLGDRSLAAAVTDPAVLRTLDACVARVNERLPPGDRIVARTFVADPAHDLPPAA